MDRIDQFQAVFSKYATTQNLDGFPYLKPGSSIESSGDGRYLPVGVPCHHPNASNPRHDGHSLDGDSTEGLGHKLASVLICVEAAKLKQIKCFLIIPKN